jgi:hypothetical protein
MADRKRSRSRSVERKTEEDTLELDQMLQISETLGEIYAIENSTESRKIALTRLKEFSIYERAAALEVLTGGEYVLAVVDGRIQAAILETNQRSILWDRNIDLRTILNWLCVRNRYIAKAIEYTNNVLRNDMIASQLMSVVNRKFFSILFTQLKQPVYIEYWVRVNPTISMIDLPFNSRFYTYVKSNMKKMMSFPTIMEYMIKYSGEGTMYAFVETMKHARSFIPNSEDYEHLDMLISRETVKTIIDSSQFHWDTCARLER